MKVKAKQYPEMIEVELDQADVLALLRGHGIAVQGEKHQVKITPPYADSEYRVQ
jgi:hypothetical protein